MLEDYNAKIFEDIKHIDDDGNEFWYARGLQGVLGYKKWDKFINVLNKSKESCLANKNNVLDHFLHVGKMVSIGSNTKKELIDYKLSRYDF